MKKYLVLLFLTFTKMILAQHTNILINNSGDPNEPSIVVNPKNTNNIVAGSNLDHLYVSNDAGLTWNKSLLSSAYTTWGDPCLITDTNGHVFYFHLSNPASGSWIDRIVCQKSIDEGATWPIESFTGLNPPKDQDKEWVVVDQKTNAMYVTWTEFDNYSSSNTNDSSRILFAKSIDAGITWTTPVRINKISGDCIDSDTTVEGATPAVGPNGEIYVSWVGANGIYFDRSLDTGNTWLVNDVFVTNVPGGWDYSIPGIYRSNGLPITMCDLSGGPNHGTIYINWSDQRNGINDTDVWLVKSTDGGNTWSSPIRVNDDGVGNQQFFTWMTIDQVTGYLYFVFYDRRNYTDNNTDVYMAVSRDGGNTFTNFEISENPFVPSALIFFGDYTNISAHNNVIRPIWARMDGSTMSIWTAIVDLSAALSESDLKFEKINDELEQNFPNPFNTESYISFKLNTNSTIRLFVYDSRGRVAAELIQNEYYQRGKHKVQFNSINYKLTPGLYYYRLITENGIKTKKLIIE